MAYGHMSQVSRLPFQPFGVAHWQLGRVARHLSESAFMGARRSRTQGLDIRATLG